MKKTIATVSNPRYRNPLESDVVVFSNENGVFAVTEELGVFRKSDDETEVTAIIEGQRFAYTEEPFEYTGANEKDVTALFND